jgi:hypothetical protein
MAILFVAGEDSDLATTGTTAVDTTSTHRRTAYCRCALQATNGGGTWDTGNAMSVASAWIHARVWMTDVPGLALFGSSLVNDASIRITDAAGIVRLILYMPSLTTGVVPNTIASNWQFAKVNAAGTVTPLGSPLSAIFSGSPTSPDAIDIQITNYATGGSGTVNIWINGVLAFNVSSATLATDANTTINGVRFCGIGLSGSNSVAFSYSEVILSDSDTRSVSLATLTPAANGNTDNWDIGGVSNINEIVLNDTTLNASGTPGQIQQYTTGVLPSGTFGVLAVVLSGRMMAGFSGGPTKVDFGVRTASVDHWSADVTLSNSLATVQHVFAVDPGTSLPFDPAVLGVGFNVGLRSIA